MKKQKNKNKAPAAIVLQSEIENGDEMAAFDHFWDRLRISSSLTKKKKKNTFRRRMKMYREEDERRVERN